MFERIVVNLEKIGDTGFSFVQIMSYLLLLLLLLLFIPLSLHTEHRALTVQCLAIRGSCFSFLDPLDSW
jgi:hypothetical protein